jgi:hypothetical protein
MRHRHSFVGILSMLVLGLAGCAVTPERRPERSQVEDLLAYYHRVSAAPLDVQRKEFLDATAILDRTPSDDSRLRLALALMLPGVPWRDDSRVVQLLGAIEVPSGEQASPRRDLAVLLEKMVQVRRDDHKRCEQKMEALRDDRRKVEQKLDSTREECKKADLLQQKLDELRDIDRDLRSKRPSRQTKP